MSLITELVDAGAFAGKSSGYTIANADTGRSNLAQCLELEGVLVKHSVAHGATTWALSQHGSSLLRVLEPLNDAEQTFKPRAGIPLKDRTSYELVGGCFYCRGAVIIASFLTHRARFSNYTYINS